MSTHHSCGRSLRRLRSILAAAAAAGLLAGVVSAQEAADDPAPKAAPAATLPEFDRSLAGVTRGRDLLDAVVEKYRKAAAIRDKAVITLRTVSSRPVPDQRHEVPLIISRDAAMIVLDKLTFTAIDGTLYGEYASKPDRLYSEDYEGPLTASLFTTHQAIFPLPHFGLCLSVHPVDDLFFFTFDARVVGHRTITDPERGVLEQIRIESTTDGAPCTLSIDAATGLAVRFEAELRSVDDPTTGWDVTTEMTPAVLEEFPLEEFVVRTEGRKEVSSIGFLTAEAVTSDLVGTPAPRFEFADPEGKSISLDDCFGKAAVITFWWIPSEAQFPVLDMLGEIEKWVQEEKVNAVVVPVNCGDRVEDLDLYLASRSKRVARWRDEGGRTSIKDYFAPIWPTTVVISPAGKVTHAFITTDPGATFVERVRNAVKRSLQEDL